MKRATEPALHHFTEVTYYALALAAAIEREGLGDPFAVGAEGFVWPGTHDAIGRRRGTRLSPATEAFIADLKAHLSALEPPLKTIRGIIDALRGDRASRERESR